MYMCMHVHVHVRACLHVQDYAKVMQQVGQMFISTQQKEFE